MVFINDWHKVKAYGWSSIITNRMDVYVKLITTVGEP